MGRGFHLAYHRLSPPVFVRAILHLVLHVSRSGLPETRRLRWQTIGSFWSPMLSVIGSFPLATRLQIVGLETILMRVSIIHGDHLAQRISACPGHAGLALPRHPSACSISHPMVSGAGLVMPCTAFPHSSSPAANTPVRPYRPPLSSEGNPEQCHGRPDRIPQEVCQEYARYPPRGRS